MNSAPARHGSGTFADDFAAKHRDDVVVGVITPIHQRLWVRQVLFGLACAAGLAGAVALGLLDKWREAQQADLARQRQCLETFLHSAEFAAFARATDVQLVALNNFISARPAVAQAALPEMKAFEQAHRLLPWVTEVLPLPIFAAATPARVLAAHHTIAVLLARRGHRLEPAAERAGRDLMLRLATAHARTFLQRTPDNDFTALGLERGMQEAMLGAFGAHYGPGAGAREAERIFALYAQIGPAMWRIIEQEGAGRTPADFAAPRR